MGFYSSKHGHNSDDGTDDDCVILDYSKQVRIFSPK
jgi:hypothetical protein